MIGQRIREAREALGWTEEELAQRAGLPLERIESLERGTAGKSPLFIYAGVCPPLGIELPEFVALRALADPARFGDGMQTLRFRLRQSQADLAAVAGISVLELKDLERGVVHQEVGATVQRLAGRLDLALVDLCFILFESLSPRRFRVYNVGIGKSGTMSMARIFSLHTAWHEFLSEPSLRCVFAHWDGGMDDEAMDGFLGTRDRLGNLEIDSAGFHANYVERLVRLFPDARFIVTIRDCYSWLDSFLDTILNDVPSWPEWHFEGIYERNFGLTRDMISSKAKLVAELPRVLDSLLLAWADPNRRILAAVPESRRLVVKTGDISESLPELSRFVGVSEETLDGSASRANVRPTDQRHGLLGSIDVRTIEESVKRTSADLMESFFPDHGLDRYVEHADGTGDGP